MGSETLSSNIYFMRSETLPSVIYFMGSETLPSVTLWGRKRFLLSVASDPDQEYIYFFLVILIKNIYTLRGRKRFLLPITYFYSTCKKEPFPTPSMGTETLPSACYILSCYILSSIPFYSTSNGYTSIPFYSTSNGYKYNFILRISYLLSWYCRRYRCCHCFRRC